jgi:hypothetical protein
MEGARMTISHCDYCRSSESGLQCSREVRQFLEKVGLSEAPLSGDSSVCAPWMGMEGRQDRREGDRMHTSADIKK